MFAQTVTKVIALPIRDLSRFNHVLSSHTNVSSNNKWRCSETGHVSQSSI